MQNNPLAKTIHKIFEKDIVKSSCQFENYAQYKNSIESIKKFKRIKRFTTAINHLFYNNGLPCFNTDNLMIDEKKLINFALQISGYIRDDQVGLDKLKNSHAREEDIINLYKASANYTVACTNQVQNNKYIFKHHKNYNFWKIENPQDLQNSAYSPIETQLDPQHKHLILSMPFHIKTNQTELQNWCYKYMHNIFEDAEIFGSKVNVSLAHFPIEQPRGEKFALSLQTMNQNNDYYDRVDAKFVKDNLSSFIGKELRFDDQMNVIGGEKYSAQEFQENCRNLTILGYCAGTAHSHRWINTIEKVAKQLYTQEETAKAMSNIFVLSYAFLPFQKQNSYSGAHFMSNYANDSHRKEPFIKMFNPELYEQVKYTPTVSPARIVTMPDQRNFIIAHRLAEKFNIIENNKKIVELANQENGHHISLITTPNLTSKDNFPYQQFRTILENASLGKRSTHIFDHRDFNTPEHIIQNAAVVWQKQEIPFSGKILSR